jgi:hypothetical protein
MLNGIDAIKKSNMEMAKSGMVFKYFEMATYKLSSSSNLIIETGTYKMSCTMPGMEAPMKDNGK